MLKSQSIRIRGFSSLKEKRKKKKGWWCKLHLMCSEKLQVNLKLILPFENLKTTSYVCKWASRYSPVALDLTSDPAQNSYLCHICSFDERGLVDPADLSHTAQSHTDSSNVQLVIGLSSSQTYINLTSVDFSPVAILNKHSLKVYLIPNPKAKSFFSITALAISAMLTIIKML